MRAIYIKIDEGQDDDGGGVLAGWLVGRCRCRRPRPRPRSSHHHYVNDVDGGCTTDT